MTTLSLVSRFAPLPLAVLLAAPLAQAADFPTSAELQYVGPYGVPATMTFNRSGSNYKVVASIKAGGVLEVAAHEGCGKPSNRPISNTQQCRSSIALPWVSAGRHVLCMGRA